MKVGKWGPRLGVVAFLAANAGCHSQSRSHVARSMGEPVLVAQARCEAGEDAACEALGQRSHLGGDQGVTNLSAAAGWFERGCHLGGERSCRELAQLRLHAAGSLRLLPHCRERGDVGVCLALGRANLFGLRTDRSAATGIELLSTACLADTEHEHLRLESCSLWALALLIGPGELEPSPELATRLLRAWCGPDAPHACSYLAFAYEMGLGVPRRRGRAVELYSASRRVEFSRFRLARMGLGVADASPVTTMELWRRLCLDEDPAGPPIARVACHRAAVFAVENGYPGALAYAALSCRKGWAPACTLLGTLYEARDAVVADLDTR